ncbi:hypothetical protein ACO0RG_004765 [Hanseniaspora osmophila]
MSLTNDILFTATTVHLEHITTALNCLVPFGAKEDVLIIIDEEGLSFASEKSHIIKIQLFLSKDLFTLYNFDSSKAPFEKVCVKLNHILDSVNVANNVNNSGTGGSSNSNNNNNNNNNDETDFLECTLSYDGDGTPFVFIFEDALITERMEYSTYLIKEMDVFDILQIDLDRIEYECIIQGDILFNTLQDLKELDCKECYLYVSAKKNNKPHFSFIFKNEQLGLSRISLPSERTCLEKVEFMNNADGQRDQSAPQEESISYFDFQMLDKISKSVKIASKVLFRKDTRGVLSVNILSKTNNIIPVGNFRKSSATLQNRKKTNVLPKNYSGIVIDITMIEKESESGFQDIIEMVNRDENTISTKIRASRKRRRSDEQILDDEDSQNANTTSVNLGPTQNKKPGVPLFF